MKCQNISKELYNILKNPMRFGGQVYWNCDSCLASAVRLEAKMTLLETRVNEVEERVARSEGVVQAVEKRVETVEKRQDQVEGKVDKERERLRKERIDEMRGRDIKKRNVIMHRVEEAGEDAKTYEERRNWDTMKCEEIFTALKLNLTKDNIKFCKRVGEKGEKPRPMIVGLFREYQKEDILDGARELRNTPLADVGIMPDLTQEQRRDEGELIQEAVRRNEEVSEEDKAKNWFWRAVGRRGEKRLVRELAKEGERREPTEHQGRARREGRPTTCSRTEGESYEGPRSREREARRERGSERVCERGRTRRRSKNEAGKQEGQGGRRGGGEDEAAATRGQCLSELKILYLNAQSVVGKIDELASTATEIGPDLILLTESWCSGEISHAFLNWL